MTNTLSTIVNIAAYKFIALDELPRRRRELKSLCSRLSLKGTILLSTEGLNLFLAGSRGSIDEFLVEVRSDPAFADLKTKDSYSDRQPFNRLLVRLKREIIAFGVEGIEPAKNPSPKLSAKELKKWLDEGRPLTLLDTRNDYEVQLGTFENAVDLDIDHFRHFPEAIKQLPPETRERPVVMFCTGGIRCEKAGPLMEREGFKEVFQLDGGILKYFEECGGDHYDGECFVFDQRVALDPNLEETATTQCFACQAPLNAADQQAETYVLGEHCPHCYEEFLAKHRATIEQRQMQLAEFAKVLPGSVPYDHIRPLNIPKRFDQATLLDTLDGLHPHMGRDQWKDFCERGFITFEDHEKREHPVDPQRIVRAGQRYNRHVPAMVEPAVNADIRILHEDDAIVVLSKPAPLPMHSGGRFHRNTVNFFLDEVYAPQKLRFVHRLDANTTGVVVCARTKAIARNLQVQFEAGTVEKSYLVRAQGHIAEDQFTSTTSIGRDTVQAGLRLPDPDGQHARTEFKVLERCDDGTGNLTTLLEAKPITGRTNQIRIHLWELGHPVCGDPGYLPDKKLGRTQTLGVGEPPLCLHAVRLSFVHPETGEPFLAEASMPGWSNSQHVP
ncbi:sulfurtransferase [Adhaeretor mobilis]|uniref:tRNA uridine(34) hydroxylase n=1 Tax=Adhaeretor mobilis TaxID=1930276 RepID=A0A517N064_9BACT|nr:sulfurtransferase [Adhaeretor mobilis]QDT00521.1 Ribosomal large subunit pseudouridine synthase C [Adhaeretor mobilis]